MSLYGFFAPLALCMIPATLAARRDRQTIRSVNVWAKPLHFSAALALFAATTAVLMRAAGPGAPLSSIIVFATVSGFMLGGQHPRSGPGMSLVGWRRYGDGRPAHFIGAHTQKIIPAFGFIAERLPGSDTHAGFTTMTATYVLAWAALTPMQRKQPTAATAAA